MRKRHLFDRAISNRELLEKTFRVVEQNCYNYCHKGKTRKAMQSLEDDLKEECFRRFAEGVSADGKET